MSEKRYTLTAFWRDAHGRTYTQGDVSLNSKDAIIRLYRSMKDEPSRFGVPKDAELYVVGPVTCEERSGNGRWSYAGTPAATVVVIENLPGLPAPDPTPRIVSYP